MVAASRAEMAQTIECAFAAMAETGASAVVLDALCCGALGQSPCEVADIFRAALARQAAAGIAPDVALLSLWGGHDTGRPDPGPLFGPFSAPFRSAAPPAASLAGPLSVPPPSSAAVLSFQ